MDRVLALTDFKISSKYGQGSTTSISAINLSMANQQCAPYVAQFVCVGIFHSVNAKLRLSVTSHLRHFCYLESHAFHALLPDLDACTRFKLANQRGNEIFAGCETLGRELRIFMNKSTEDRATETLC